MFAYKPLVRATKRSATRSRKKEADEHDAPQGDILVLKNEPVLTGPDDDNRAIFEHAVMPDSPARSLIDISPMPSSYRCVVTDQGKIRLADEGFRESLESVGLVIEDGCLLPTSIDLRPRWLSTLSEVRATGKSQFYALTQHPKLESVGLVPQPDGRLIAIRLPRARMCSPDCVSSYASLIGLTPRETSVLDLLVQGHTPATVAAELRTRESTVRTQIKSVLAKSCHNSMRGLLVTLACLPSMSAVGITERKFEPELSQPLS